MTAIAKVCAAMFGTGVTVNGLTCTATSPAGMTVQIGPGELYQMANLENTVAGTLPQDTTHQILKQGIQLGTYTTAAFAAPSTSGQSINYLIEAQYQDFDLSLDPTTGNTPVVLQFYDAANPTQPWSGPNNSGATSNTFRDGVVAYQIKAGVAATTGSQVTPTPDTGWTGLWVVTVAYGQTQITNSSIAQYTGAPVLPSGLLQSIVTSNLTYGIDNGSANTIQATFPIPVTTLTDGMDVWVKIKAANTGATTFTPNPGVISAAPVVGGAHAALQGGELVASGRANLTWRQDISSWVLAFCTGAAEQIGPGTASQHAAQIQQIGHGQCRFVYTNATTCTLNPYNGQNLIINGVPQKIPQAGVTLSNAGLSASTGYYVYAYMNGSTMTLEASTVSYATATNGVLVKNTDATRTLVGMIYTNASSQFQFSNSVAGVLSWFNPRQTYLQPNNGTGTLTVTTATEISSALRVSTLVWNGFYADATLDGFASPATNQAAAVTGIGIDSTTTINGQPSQGNAGFAGAGVPVSARTTAGGFSELVLHTFYALGYSSTGSCSWNLSMKVGVQA
jgi:hypothetical protein